MAKTLLHICCAGCFLRYEAMSAEPIEADLFFYNPNIYPRTEYDARREAARNQASERELTFIIPDYRPRDYFAAQQELIKTGVINDKSRRCLNCLELRLAQTMIYARENDYQDVSTTMLASEYLPHKLIDDIGKKLAKKWGLNWLSLTRKELPNWRPRGFYQQNFCGCLYSLSEKTQEKFLA